MSLFYTFCNYSLQEAPFTMNSEKWRYFCLAK
jgi:hypothetical protein